MKHKNLPRKLSGIVKHGDAHHTIMTGDTLERLLDIRHSVVLVPMPSALVSPLTALPSQARSRPAPTVPVAFHSIHNASGTTDG